MQKADLNQAQMSTVKFVRTPEIFLKKTYYKLLSYTTTNDFV